MTRDGGIASKGDQVASRVKGWLDTGGHRLVALSQTEAVPESSGIIASRLSRDVYWTHNDSGHPPYVYAFRLNAADRAARLARDLGYVDLPGAKNVDWEDIAYGPGGMIYLFDGGNAPPCNRRDKHIYRFAEPKIDPQGPPVRLTARWESIWFEYPDSGHAGRPAQRDEDRYDAEALFVHPASGDLYVVTKRDTRGVFKARVYKLPAAKVRWQNRSVHVLEFVADVTAKVSMMATGADIDDAGRHVVVRDYLSAYEFELPAGRPFDEIFAGTPRAVRLLGESQGEAICYTRDQQEWVTTSEVGVIHQRRFTIYAARPPSTQAATQPASRTAQ